jgi:hypothetical protein
MKKAGQGEKMWEHISKLGISPTLMIADGVTPFFPGYTAVSPHTIN